MKILRRLAPALLATACATDEPAFSETICADANVAIEDCLGTPPTAPLPQCGADDEEVAAEILDQLRAAGCETVPEGKEDSLFCKGLLWDPLGWCSVPPPPLGAEPAGDATQFPIILAHGFNTSTTNFWRFNDVDVALAADGHVVRLGSVPPFDTPMVRAQFLADQVDDLLAETGATKVNLVCFSMGGIDCRFLVSPAGLDFGDKVASLTTISSPHRGSFVADVATKVLPGTDRSAAIDALATLYGKTFSDIADDSHVVAALQSMSEAAMVDFNAAIVDADGVFYQSWAGFSSVGGLPHPDANAESRACTGADGKVAMLRHPGTQDRMDALLVASAAMVAHGTELRPNDGVSSVESSKWGEFRGCIPADHLDQVGQIDDVGANHQTGFDYLRFYRNLAFDLAARGF
ncbi:MAG TPA: alpha/beta fold hydrolase [Nannocystaceae bacterium]|nr:alpha/beta fold hydrolase [Nannocystaceae bacterium]